MSRLEEIIDGQKKNLEKEHKVRTHLGRVFGSKVDNPPEFLPNRELLSAVEITPGKLTEAEVQAICFAMTCDPKMSEMSKYNFQELAEMSVPEYLLMNVIASEGDGGRKDRYVRATYEARLRAKEAIDQYNAGKTELVDQAMKYLADYVNGESAGHAIFVSNESQMFYSFYDMIHQVEKSDALKVLNEKIEPDVRMKMEEKIRLKQMEDKAFESTEKLASLSEEERDKAILDILCDYTLASWSHQYFEDKLIQDEMIPNATALLSGEEERAELNNALQKRFGPAICEQIQEHVLHNITQNAGNLYIAFQGKISSPITSIALSEGSPEENQEKLRSLIRDQIAMSEQYSNLIKCKNTEDVLIGLEQYRTNNSNKVKIKTDEVILDDKLEQLVRESEAKFEAGKEERKSTHLKRCKNFVLSGNADKSIVGSARRMISKAAGGREIEDLAKEVFEQHLASNHIEIDREKVFDDKLDPQTGNYIYKDVSNLTDTLFAVAKDGKSVYEFKTVVTDDYKLEVQSRKLPQVPLRTGHHMADASGVNLYEINNGIAKANARVGGNNAWKFDTKLKPYFDQIQNEAQGEIKVSIRNFDEMHEALNQLSVKMAEVREKENYQFQGRNMVRERITTPEQYQELIRCYENAVQKVADYQKMNPLDPRISDMKVVMQEELAEIKSLPITGIGMPMTKALENKRKDQLAAESEVVARGLHTGGRINPTVDLMGDAENVIKEHLFQKGPFQKWSDGTVRIEDDCRFDNQGNKLEGFEVADYLKEHENDLYEAIRARMLPFTEHYECEYNAEETIAALKEWIPDIKIPSPEERQARQALQIATERGLMDACNVRTLALLTAKPAGDVDRALQVFLKTSGSAEDHAFNRKMMKLGASTNREELKEGFEIALDMLSKVNLEDYDLRKDYLFTANPQKVLDFTLMCCDIQSVISKAQELGVDIRAPKYDVIRKNAPIIEHLASQWQVKLKMMTNPAYEVFDITQFGRKDIEKMSEISQNEADNRIIQNIASRAEDVLANNYTANNAMLRKSGTMADCIRNARKNCQQMVSVEPSDGPLVAARNAMENDVKKYFGITKKTSTPLYTNVIKAIDRLREAPYYERERLRQELVATCDTYLSHRGANKKRSILVRNVKQAAVEMKADCEMYVKEAYDRTAKSMVDGVKKALNIYNTAELGNTDKGKWARRILAGFENEEKCAKLMEALSKTKVCDRFVRHPEETTDKVQFLQGCGAAIEEASRHVEEISSWQVMEAIPQQPGVEAPKNGENAQPQNKLEDDVPDVIDMEELLGPQQ